MEPYSHLLFVSTATRSLSDGDLRDIRDAELRSYSSAGITGVLLYREGLFLQLLEGPQHAVESTFTRINNDPLHTKISILYRGPCATPQFMFYSMGVITEKLLHGSHREAYQGLTDQIATTATGHDTDRLINEVLQGFTRNAKAA